MNLQESKSVKRYIFIFASIFIFLEIVTSIIFLVTKSHQHDWLGIVYLIVSAYIASYLFARKYHRSFNSNEYREILIGSILTVVVFFLVFIQYTTTISNKLFSYPMITILITLLIFFGLPAAILAIMYSSIIVNRIVKKVYPGN
jgi:hypothetical protein